MSYNKSIMNKPCFYCKSEVYTEEQDGSFIYTIETNKPVQFAHTECAETFDDLKIHEEIDW